MSDIAKIIGQRIRNYRVQKDWSQDKLSELAGCHPTYIGQLERGEKNATLESIEKVAQALEVPLSELFENLTVQEGKRTIPMDCYNFLLGKSPTEQKQLYELLRAIDSYKHQ